MAGIILLGAAIFFIVDMTSDKLVCKSDEGYITLMYNDKTIKGYKAKNITYDLDGQKKIANQIGMKSYIEEFSKWFSENTSGTCTEK